MSIHIHKHNYKRYLLPDYYIIDPVHIPVIVCVDVRVCACVCECICVIVSCFLLILL